MHSDVPRSTAGWQSLYNLLINQQNTTSTANHRDVTEVRDERWKKHPSADAERGDAKRDLHTLAPTSNDQVSTWKLLNLRLDF